jgi:nucleoid DNA-binding protein
MIKKDLTSALELEVGLNRRESKDFVEAFIDEIRLALEQRIDASITLRGFGRFYVAEVPAREARHPRTGEKISIPARTVPRFRPSKLGLERRASEILFEALKRDQFERVIGLASSGITLCLSRTQFAACHGQLEKLAIKRADVLTGQISGESAEVQAELDALVTRYGSKEEFLDPVLLPPDLLSPPKGKPVQRRLNSFWTHLLAELPPLRERASGKVLPSAAMDAIGRAILSSRLDSPSPLLGTIGQLCSQESLTEFAWRAYEIWSDRGDSEAAGFLHVLGFWGDDAIARRLASVAKSTPATVRTLTALEVLATIGSQQALMQLQSISLFARYPKVRDRAAEILERVAKAKNMDSEQFQDQLVPNVGLNDVDTSHVSFGSQAFRLQVDEALRPRAVDAAGNTHKTLPAAIEGDDAECVRIAREKWKGFSTELKQVAKIQLPRLEKAMILGRRWNPTDFKHDVVGHALLRPIATGLVWATFKGKKGKKPLATFAVRRDGTFVDVDDKSFAINADVTVGLPHPLTLGSLIEAWKSRFEHARQGQPFPQLNRKTYRMEDDKDKDFFGLQGMEVPSIALKGLRAKGWEASVGDAGWIWGLYLGDASIHAHPGIHVSGYEYFGDTQKLEVSIENDNPVQFSELVRDLQSLQK